jgi:tetratricopeptide (TPR) repeat protein
MEREIRCGQAKAAKTCLGRPPKQADKKRIMKETRTEPTSTTDKPETAAANCQEPAWIYDHLLNEFPTHANKTTCQIKKESCWEADLLPCFQIGVKALENGQWRKAYNALAQVLMVDPYFRKDGRSAAVLSEMARKEVVLQADQQLRRGQVQEALDVYREVGHLARIENVDEFLRLRQREEEIAQQLEAEGKWQEAAAKYSYLCTLYYDENGRTQWQTAAKRCLKEHKLNPKPQGFSL